jgi:hypothetical protein
MGLNMIERMVGEIFTKVFVDKTASNDTLIFETENGIICSFTHNQDCCESVNIEDICGDLEDLIGNPILQAEEVSNYIGPVSENAESYTWTFYKFATIKGSVTVRWLGQSNGYYSESVDLELSFFCKDGSALYWNAYQGKWYNGSIALTLNEFLEVTNWPENKKMLYKLIWG